MHETDLWITKLFNDYLAGLGNTLTSLAGMPPEARPWSNFITMQLLVAGIIIVLFAILRPRLSADRPGRLQLCKRNWWIDENGSAKRAFFTH